jgi:hypothetical protein
LARGNGKWFAIEAKTGKGSVLRARQAQGFPELDSPPGAVVDTRKLSGVGFKGAG